MVERGRNGCENATPSTSRGSESDERAEENMLDNNSELCVVSRRVVELELELDTLRRRESELQESTDRALLGMSFERFLDLIKCPTSEGKSEAGKLSLVNKWVLHDSNVRSEYLPRILEALDLAKIFVEDQDLLHREFAKGSLLGDNILCLRKFNDFLLPLARKSLAGAASPSPSKETNGSRNRNKAARFDDTCKKKTSPSIGLHSKVDTKGEKEKVFTISSSSEDDDVPWVPIPCTVSNSSRKRRQRADLHHATPTGPETEEGADTGEELAQSVASSPSLIYATDTAMFAFDLKSKRTRCVSTFRPKFFSSAIVAGDELFVIGGSSPNSTFGDKSVGSKDVNILSIADNFKIRKGPPLPDPLKELGSCVINDTLYAIGGCNKGDAANFCTKLKFGKREATWEDLPDYLNIVRGAHAIATIQNIIFAIGGAGRENSFLRSVETYNTASEQPEWQCVAALDNPGRARLGAVTVDDKIYVVGGQSRTKFGEPLKTVEYYDAVRNSWIKLGSLNEGRQDHCVCVVDRQIYAIGGTGRSPVSIESFDPREGKWELISERNLDVTGHFNNAVTIMM